jgi:hypothetical protein
VEWTGTRGARELYGCAIVLVRPDGIVAWRGEQCPADPEALVDQATGRKAGRDAAGTDD